MKLKIVLIILLFSNLAYSINYETKGNLKSNTKVLPDSIEQVKNIHNPVDLFKLCVKLIKSKQVDKSAKVYYAAIAYGIFDAERVVDKTAY